jgi:hypothetical protein
MREMRSWRGARLGRRTGKRAWRAGRFRMWRMILCRKLKWSLVQCATGQ